MSVSSIADLLEILRQHQLLEPTQIDKLTQSLSSDATDPRLLGRELLRRGLLTSYQINQTLKGRARNLLLGSYVLMDQLGEGAMGQVFKARHRGLDRVVALKLIRKERLANAADVRRFQREIRAAAQLSHPNIVHALDADEVAGTHFLVMEYVKGTNLAHLVKKDGVLPVEIACDYIRQAALGLQHAHERGLIHRDIKPGNLLFSQPGSVVKILDLGLARLGEENEIAESTLTQEGTVLGTPDFIAPEQARESHGCDHRADLYSLGCTFYYLLTGQVPFPGGTLTQKLLKHQLEDPIPIEHLRPETPTLVVGIIRKLMAKRPEDRFTSAAELALALSFNEPTCLQTFDPAGGGIYSQAAETKEETYWGSIFDSLSRPLQTCNPGAARPFRLSAPCLVLYTSGICGLLLALWIFLYVLLRDSAEGSQTVKEEPAPIIAYKKKPKSRPEAIELRQKDAASCHNVGLLRSDQGKLDDAIATCKKAIELDPRNARAHFMLAMEYNAQGKLDQAICEGREALRLDPAGAHRRWLIDTLSPLGRLEEARAAWEQGLAGNPPAHEAWSGYAELCLYLNNENAYRCNRKALLEHFGQTTDPVIAERTARACLLLPATGKELLQAAALADRAVTLGKDHEYYPFFMAAKALAEYRLDRFESAIDWGQKAGARGAWTPTHLVLAMAHHRLGHPEQAHQSLDEAVKSYDWKNLNGEAGGMIHALRREAEALLKIDLEVKDPCSKL